MDSPASWLQGQALAADLKAADLQSRTLIQYVDDLLLCYPRTLQLCPTGMPNTLINFVSDQGYSFPNQSSDNFTKSHILSTHSHWLASGSPPITPHSTDSREVLASC